MHQHIAENAYVFASTCIAAELHCSLHIQPTCTHTGKWISCVWSSIMCECECIPSLLRVFVTEGQDVWGPAAAITHHHRDGRCVPEILQHNGDHIWASFYDESHHWHPLTNTCTWKQVGAGETERWRVIVERKTGRNNTEKGKKKCEEERGKLKTEKKKKDSQ